MEQDIGFSYPGWKIVRLIGTGSYGKVYEVAKEDAFSNVEHSALKVISVPATSAELDSYRNQNYDNESITAILRSEVESITSEFELMSCLKGQSNIVSYEDHEIVQHKNDMGWDILIRMELLTSLSAYCRGRTIDEKTVIKIGIDICHALELCKKHNIIHRDIKPQNIFINKDGNFKLGDFGVAKRLDLAATAAAHSIAGSYPYMAPEVFKAQPYDASVDIYSLGMVLYELLNENRGPFLPLPPNIPTAKEKQNAQTRRFGGASIPEPKNGSSRLKQIILKACSFNCEDRYQSAEQMRMELEELAGPKHIPEFSVNIVGKSGTFAYDGKEHFVEGYEVQSGEHAVEVRLIAGKKARISATRPGVFPMGLTQDDFEVCSKEQSAKVGKVHVTDGYLEIESPHKSQRKKGWIAGVCFLAAIVAVGMALFGILNKPNVSADKPVNTETTVMTSAETVPAVTDEADAAEVVGASEEQEVKVLLTLTPDEEASYNDVRHDAPIVASRLNHFLGSDDIAHAEDGSVYAEIPLEKFGSSGDLDSVIRSVINRPMELYFIRLQGWSMEYAEEGAIPREDILEITALTAEEANQKYQMPLEYTGSYGQVETMQAEQPCILIRMNQDAVDTIDLLEHTNWSLTLGVDMTMGDPVYFPYMYALEDGQSFVVSALKWPERALTDALIYGYSNEPLNQGYYFSYELSPKAFWETDSRTFGSYQCTYEELPEDVITFTLASWDPSTVSDESFSIVMEELKHKLDIIGLPYAIGIDVRDSKGIVICTSPERLNTNVLSLLGTSKPSLTVNDSSLQDQIYSLNIVSSAVVFDEQAGTYGLKLQLSDGKLLEEITSSLRWKPDKSFILDLYGQPMAQTEVTDVSTDASITLENAAALRKEKVAEDNKYIFDLLQYVLSTDYSPESYTIQDYTFSDNGVGFGKTLLSEEEQAIVDTLSDYYPDATARIEEDDVPHLYISLNTSIESNFIGNAFDAVADIFKIYDLDNQSFDLITIYLVKENGEERCRLLFQKPLSWEDARFLTCVGYCSGGYLNAYRDEFIRQANNRYFFTKRGFQMYEDIFGE